MSSRIKQYDQDFAHAMSVKLRMSRKKKILNDDEFPLTKDVGELRARLIRNAVGRHHGLTFTQAFQMMNELGF